MEPFAIIFEYHNEHNFRNETPLRVWAEKGAIRDNHRWNRGSHWQPDLIEVRGYDWPQQAGWVRYNLPDQLTNRHVFIKPCYDMCASVGGFIGIMGEFMQSVHEKRPALTNGRDNLMSLRMYFAGQLSAAQSGLSIRASWMCPRLRVVIRGVASEPTSSSPTPGGKDMSYGPAANWSRAFSPSVLY